MLILANLLIVRFCIYQSFVLIDWAQNLVLILYNGKVLEAFASNRKADLPVELRGHIENFHQYFFNLSPDDKAIQAGVTKRCIWLMSQQRNSMITCVNRDSGSYINCSLTFVNLIVFFKTSTNKVKQFRSKDKKANH